MRSNRSTRKFVVPSAIGWIGAAGWQDSVVAVSIGHATAEAAEARLAKVIDLPLTTSNWNPTLRRRLHDYTDGAPVDFLEFDVELGDLTPFSRAVIESCRHISYGETLSYGGLASRAGAPGAARAVGNVMRNNRCPLVIPCHRVVHNDGRVGNFSAPQGVRLKERLLAMEAASLAMGNLAALL